MAKKLDVNDAKCFRFKIQTILPPTKAMQINNRTMRRNLIQTLHIDPAFGVVDTASRIWEFQSRLITAQNFFVAWSPSPFFLDGTRLFIARLMCTVHVTNLFYATKPKHGHFSWRGRYARSPLK